MVDNFADKRISEFMHQADKDGQQLLDENDPLAGALGIGDETSSNSTTADK